jgi:hypothetical protein
MKILVALCVLAGSAHAERVDLPNTKATLDIPDGWTKVPAKGPVVAYKRGGSILAVARAQVPNPEAWKAKTRDAYLAEIERGAIAAVGGQKRLARKAHEVNGVPTLDLEIAREGGSSIVMRVLVFRTYVISTSISVPKGTALDQARAITATFAPPKDT